MEECKCGHEKERHVHTIQDRFRELFDCWDCDCKKFQNARPQTADATIYEREK